MSRFPKTDLSGITLISIDDRNSKVGEESWARPFDPDGTFRQFVDSLPDMLIARELRTFASLTGAAVRLGKPVILMRGAHVV
jgi:hypothetical protein